MKVTCEKHGCLYIEGSLASKRSSQTAAYITQREGERLQVAYVNDANDRICRDGLSCLLHGVDILFCNVMKRWPGRNRPPRCGVDELKDIAKELYVTGQRWSKSLHL